MKYTAFVILLCASVTAMAQDIRVTQVDTHNLLAKGTVDVYVSLTGPGSSGVLEAEDFSARESSLGPKAELDIVSVTVGAAKETGINFLLLIDNSGSMYEETFWGRTRMEDAQLALESFLKSVDGSEDKVALFAFNTYLVPLARLGASAGELKRGLRRVEQPDREASYTELYSGLYRSVSELNRGRGRKAVIVLSDGEDYPFSRFSGLTHPLWGDELISAEAVIQRFQEEEVTLYAVNFADERDPRLSQIAYETGGSIFEARTSTGLTDVYASIREDIQKEVRLTIRVPTGPSADRSITIGYKGDSDAAGFFAPLLLRAPGAIPWYIPLIIVFAAAMALMLLHFAHLESPAKEAELQAVGEGVTVVMQDEVTVIGSAPEAHLTLTGDKGIDQNHATVVHDTASGNYTLISERPVRANNKLVKKQNLRPGDVIGIEGATLVFDAPEKGPDTDT